jgi:hypothetical protein
MANRSQVANIPGGSASTDPHEAGRFQSSSTFAPETPTPNQGAGSLASELKDTARTATEAIRRQAAQFAQDAGHELGKTGEFQKARGVDALRRFARAELARAQPVLFVGGSIAAGFALARFLMSSSRQRSGGHAGSMNSSFEQ